MDDPDTEYAKTHYQIASRLYSEGKYDEALKEFSNALIAKPLPAFYFNIGRCYDRLGNYEEAVKAYQAYVETNPPDGDMARNRIHDLKERIIKMKGGPAVKPPVQSPPSSDADTLLAPSASAPDASDATQHCSNHVKDADEKDIDCGGSCPRCGGDPCTANYLCWSGVCTGGSCAAPTCEDRLKNGGESDEDCGHVCAIKCAENRRCDSEDDCRVGLECRGRRCLAPPSNWWKWAVGVGGAILVGGIVAAVVILAQPGSTPEMQYPAWRLP